MTKPETETTPAKENKKRSGPVKHVTTSKRKKNEVSNKEKNNNNNNNDAGETNDNEVIVSKWSKHLVLSPHPTNLTMPDRYNIPSVNESLGEIKV